jgi:hypothetical protein
VGETRSRAPRERGDWDLSAERWDRLLRTFDQDGRRYNLLRRKLEKFFEYNCPGYLSMDPGTMADRTLDKLATKLEAREVEPSGLETYALRIARFDLQEAIRKHWRIGAAIRDFVRRYRPEFAVSEHDHECVESSLARLDEDDRAFIENFYAIRKKTNAERRRACDIVKRLRSSYENCRKARLHS